MDDRRFDDLTRRLASGTSRRQVLKTLAGGAFGGLAGALGLGRASAAGCNTDAECARGETCDAAAGRCIRRGGGRPVSQQQSQSVGIAAVCITDGDCAANETCVDSVCTPRGGQCVRGSTCLTDATCCGGEVCDTAAGVCVGAGGPCTNTTGFCVDSTDCCGNEDCVAGVCQRTVGGCAPGAVCAGDTECCGGQVCINGACAQAARPAGCPDGQVRCSGTCVDIRTDPNNCSGCGVVCESGNCVDRICISGNEICPDGRPMCNDAYRGGNICCDTCSTCARSGEGEIYCKSTCLGPNGLESACAPCVDGVCGEDPCDYTSEYCDFATGECVPFQQRVCPDGRVCPPGEVCGSSGEGETLRTVCCPEESPGVCGGYYGFSETNSYLGCRCTTERGAEGCEVDGVCCQSFSAPGECYCAPSTWGCSTQNPECADPNDCAYCCSGVCIIAEGFVDQGNCA